MFVKTNEMATKQKAVTIGEQIKELLSRNQRWLARQINMREALLSEKINEVRNWTQEDLDKINKVLGTNFKL